MNNNMMTSPSSLMKQLINRVVALYLHEHPDCSIDDLVIAAATPAIHTQFKEIDPKQMYLVMLRMKHFVSLDKTEHVPPLKTVKSVQFWS